MSKLSSQVKKGLAVLGSSVGISLVAALTIVSNSNSGEALAKSQGAQDTAVHAESVAVVANSKVARLQGQVEKLRTTVDSLRHKVEKLSDMTGKSLKQQRAIRRIQNNLNEDIAEAVARGISEGLQAAGDE